MQLSAELLPQALDSVSEGLLIVDRKFRILFANKAFTGLFGDFEPAASLIKTYPSFARAASTNITEAFKGKKDGYLDFCIAEEKQNRNLAIEFLGIKVSSDVNNCCLIQVRDLTDTDLKTRELFGRLSEMNLQLAAARRYQEALFTSNYRDNYISCEAMGIAATELSGDFFYVSSENNLHLIVLGDVQGHGIDVAMKAITIQHLCRIIFARAPDVAEVMDQLNGFVCSDQKDKFWTCCLFITVYDAERGKCTYCRAGIPEPILISRDNSVQYLSRGDMPLGYFEEETYGRGVIDISEGDRMLLVSDGITEATLRSNGSMLGHDGLVEQYRKQLLSSDGHIVTKLAASLTELHGDTKYKDDLTLAELIFSSG